MIGIYFDDLAKAKQDEIVAVFRDNENFDVYPIATLRVYGDEEQMIQEQVYDGNANGICTD